MSSIAWDPEGVVGGYPIDNGKPPKQAPAGRICANPTCTTVLSIYNVDDQRCAPCQRAAGTNVRCGGTAS